MKRAALIVLDGWGIGDGGSTDAIAQAKTPVFDQLMKQEPNATLKTFGENVGLPEGQMGNSEVGHLNIGAGRIVYQDLVRINFEVENGSLADNEVLNEAIDYAKTSSGRIHFIGLLSHGGVHSDQSHLHALIDITESAGCADVFIHAFTDGRDTNQSSAKSNIVELENHLEGKSARLVSMIGRYFAMDRDKRWDRTKIAYDLLINGIGSEVESFSEACDSSYSNGITDEFFESTIIAGAGGRIQPNDTVICYNFRTDRCRQITEVLTQKDHPEVNMSRLPLHYVTMTRYDASFKNVHVMHNKDNIENTLGEVISKEGGTQLRIAETEKHPHVTFFFSGGRETLFKGEMREIVASPKVATYDLQPEMSAEEVANKCLNSISNDQPDFICLNFANPDMVGHTGVHDAIVTAVEKVDALLGGILESLKVNNYNAIIIADHGNADITQLPDGTPHTAHTTNPVPCILVGKSDAVFRHGILADVAPTILALMEIDQPDQMTGKSLLQ